jgi:hypothetical protein
MIKNLIIVGLMTLSAALAFFLYDVHARVASESESSLALQPVTVPPVRTPVRVVAPTPERGAAIDFSGSYQNLAVDLRGEGFDDELVRQIVFATMKRDRTLDDANTTTLYWKRPAVDRNDVQSQLQRDAEQRRDLLDLFGDDVIDDPLFQDLFKPMNKTLPFLSSDKQIALYELQQENDLRFQRRTITTPESAQEMQAARRAYEEAVAQLLSPEELLEYQLRSSQLASVMRNMSGDFEYTEQEFRDLYQIRTETPEAFGFGGDRSEFRERNEVATAKIKDYLGPDRFAEYQRSRDPAYGMIKSIGEHNGADGSEIVSMYSETTKARDAMRDLRSDDSLNDVQLRERAEAIWAEAINRIEDIGGADAADAIRDSGPRLGMAPRRPGRDRR